MIPTIKKILYTTDLSMNSAYAFCYALDYARKMDAKIVILHIHETLDAATQSMLASFTDEAQVQKLFQDKREHAAEQIQERLKILCEKAFEEKINPSDLIDAIEVKEGYPAEVILQTALELNVDVIIMGTHSKGPIQNTFLGSVAKRVLRRTSRPMFVIPIPRGKIDVSMMDI